MHLLIFYFISSITIFTSYLTSWTPCVFLAINCQVFLLYLCICLELTIHMIRADIETEVSPIVGSEKQSEELVNYLLSEFENDPQKIWESNIFGKVYMNLLMKGFKASYTTCQKMLKWNFKILWNVLLTRVVADWFVLFCNS